ncbi:MAG: DUF2312 domain-containing protein [Ahrensia sp.]|nr:DUF2312 domain-containing protein [Ahrensia sp.]
MNDQYNVTADELLQFIERLEHFDREKRDIVEMQKGVMVEAKGRGYSAPIIREIIKLRRMKPDDRAEREAVLDIYLSSLGMV